MMALLFLLMLVVLSLAWLGKRRWAIAVFTVAFILTLFWFGHHLTSHLDIQLLGVEKHERLSNYSI